MRLNYQHLFYFWTVVRCGGLMRASEELRLSAPAVSTQLRQFEARLGEKLLTKSGRRLVPTEAGQLVYRYADEIFRLGREMADALEGRPTNRPLELVVGVDDVLPKEVAHRLIQPALQLDRPISIVCREASLERLVADLASHDVDVVLSDAPASPTLNVRAYNHHLGECGLVWMGAPSVAKERRKNFPRSLDGAPALLPTDDTAIRRSLDQWCDRAGVRPQLLGEFEDYALLREFGRAGTGVFPVPTVLERQFCRQYGVLKVGIAEGVRYQFYAISVERRIRNPAVLAICNTARRELFT